MHDKLELLLADGIIDEVLGGLKSGKEADIWLVRHGGEVIAAKIYKEREDRSFRNNAGYKEGRAVRNSRTQRAIDKGSRFGRAAAEDAWKSAEADAIYKLHAHGVRTPRPVLFYEGVLLMELVTGADGHPARRLIDAGVSAEAAGAIYRDLRSQVVRMLCADLIHGDLSAYNVLLGAQGPTIIDFPQVIAAAQNNRAEAFFHRDLENLRRHLAGYDRALHGCGGDAREIWRAYVRRELTPEFVPSGRAPEPRDRQPAHPDSRRRGEPRYGQQRPGRPAQPPPRDRGGPPAPRGAGAAPAGNRSGQGRAGPVVERVFRPVASGAPAGTPPSGTPGNAPRPGHSGRRHGRRGWRR